MNSAEKKAKIESLGWDECKFWASGENKGLFKLGMKKYNGTPIFFGISQAFAYDFNYEGDGVTPAAPDWAKVSEIEKAIKQKQLVLGDIIDENYAGVLAVAFYDPVEQMWMEGVDQNVISGYLGLTAADMSDIEQRITTLVDTYIQVTTQG